MNEVQIYPLIPAVFMEICQCTCDSPVRITATCSKCHGYSGHMTARKEIGAFLHSQLPSGKRNLKG
jgi:hypothetical protein